MSELSEKHCKPCEGNVTPLSHVEAKAFLSKLHPDWRLAQDSKSISREWQFKNFYHTMSFVNAAAYIANAEDHHPDLEVGYGYCRMKFNTHSIGGLSENDFICGAKVDALGTG